MSHLEGILPQAPEAERAILGCFLQFPKETREVCQFHGISASHFHTPSHGTIFRHMEGVELNGMPVEFVTVTTALRESEQLEAVGGAAAISSLITDSGGTTTQLGYYIAQVKRAAQKRRFLALAENLSRQAREPDLDPQEIAGQLVESANAIAEPGGLAAIKAELEARLAHPDDVVPEDLPIYSINGTPICHKGNITMVEAQAKAGKTAFLGALMASTYSQTGADCLGWQSRNLEGRAMLHFDTEQSRADHNALTKRVHARAGATLFPEWLRSYRMTGMTTTALKQAVEIALRIDSQKFGGVHSLIIDGIGDLVPSVNDEAPSTDIVIWLMGLADEYQIPIIVVLHLNPIAGKGQTPKARGHLGSQLYRKCEHTLRLDKNADQVTTVTSVNPRKAPLTADSAPCFAWSAEHRWHVSVSPPKSKTENKREQLEGIADDVFRDTAGIGLRRCEVITRIKTATGKRADSTAENRINEMFDQKIIRKDESGLYFRT